MKNLANYISVSRIMMSIVLLFTETFSLAFYLVYIYCGASDMLDGFVARKSRNESKLGARIDSVADMIFVFVAMIKILPILDLTSRIVIWTAFIALVKIINVVYGYIRYRKIILPHTTANKITGLILFIAPFIIVSFDPIIPEIVICTIATIAAIHEGFYVGTKKSSSTISLDLLR